MALAVSVALAMTIAVGMSVAVITAADDEVRRRRGDDHVAVLIPLVVAMAVAEPAAEAEAVAHVVRDGHERAAHAAVVGEVAVGDDDGVGATVAVLPGPARQQRHDEAVAVGDLVAHHERV